MELRAWFESLLFGGADGERPTAGDRPVESTPQIVTVIGSGGKTSLIWHLAATLGHGRRILVTPTTKMFVPRPEEKLYDRYYDANSLRDANSVCDGFPSPVPGVTLAGSFNEAIGKLESLPLPALAQLVTNRRGDAYDLVLIEADGAKGLPLKAWAAYEPVIPAFTTLTVGVLPLWPLGKQISEGLIHRLPLFLSLTGAAAGETLKPVHIITLITGSESKGESGPPGGLFAKARGKRLLFFNQIEDEEALRRAREIAGLLPPGFRNGLCGVIAGSVQKARCEEI